MIPCTKSKERKMLDDVVQGEVSIDEDLIILEESKELQTKLRIKPLTDYAP